MNNVHLISSNWYNLVMMFLNNVHLENFICLLKNVFRTNRQVSNRTIKAKFMISRFRRHMETNINQRPDKNHMNLDENNKLVEVSSHCPNFSCRILQ